MTDSPKAKFHAIRTFARIAATILCSIVVFVFIHRAQSPGREEVLPLALKETLAAAPERFLPRRLRDSEISLGVESPQAGRLVTSISHTRFDFLEADVRGPFGVLPLGKPRIVNLYLIRDPVTDGYAAQIAGCLQDCVATFGPPQRQLVSDYEEPPAARIEARMNWFWYFDSVEVWLLFELPNQTPLRVRNEDGTSARITPPLAYTLRIMPRGNAERRREQSYATYRDPNPEEAAQIQELLADNSLTP